MLAACPCWSTFLLRRKVQNKGEWPNISWNYFCITSNEAFGMASSAVSFWIKQQRGPPWSSLISNLSSEAETGGPYVSPKWCWAISWCDLLWDDEVIQVVHQIISRHRQSKPMHLQLTPPVGDIEFWCGTYNSHSSSYKIDWD
jgi:hypothetical protein